LRDDELLARYPDLPRDVEWVPLVHARALPGGAVEREFYESIKTELIARLRAVLHEWDRLLMRGKLTAAAD